MIDDSANDDNSTVCLTQTKLTQLKIFKGDPVLLRGKKRKGFSQILIIFYNSNIILRNHLYSTSGQ